MTAGPTLGEFLRQEREKRGVTIEQVASATKVGIRLLHSIEADHYAELPAKPFIRGFVTAYARFIGLDAKQVLTQYNDFIDQRAHDRPNREGGHSGYAFDRRESDQGRMFLWVVMGAFVVVGGILMFVLKPSLHHHHQTQIEKLREAHLGPSPSPSVSVVAAVAAPDEKGSAVKADAKPSPKPSPKTAKAPVVAQKPAPKPSPEASRRPDPLNSGADLKGAEIHYKILFKALANVWVRYQVDAKDPMKFMFKKGKILVLKAGISIRFQASNPDSLLANYAGRGYRPLKGDKNFVVRQNNATFFFPSDLAEKIQEPFPNDKPLPSTPGPSAAPGQSLSTPAD